MPLRALLATDESTTALFLRTCAGNTTLFKHYCQNRNLDRADATLTRWERLIIWLYTHLTANWYLHINDGLRSSTPSVDVLALSHLLTTALQKLPRHEGQVFRGIRVADLTRFLARYEVDAEVTWPAFSSASIEQFRALIGNVVFIIRSHSWRAVAQYAADTHEIEVIFVPGSRFRVDGVEHTGKRAIIDLSELPLPSNADKGETV